MKFIVWGPDGIPVTPKPFGSRLDAEKCIDNFVQRFVAQGYYAGVNFQLPLSEIRDRCRIEEVQPTKQKSSRK